MQKIWEIFRGIGRFILAPFEFLTKYFKAFLLLLLAIALFAPSKEVQNESNLAEISLKGAIFSADYFLDELERIRELPNLKGVLLVVDSPGGALAPSVEIAEEMRRLKEEQIPIVVYAQGTMASGSYYAGIWSDYIIANRGSLIGSIGVIFNGMDISELTQKLGIKPQIIKAGKYKESGTFMRAWNRDESEEITHLVQTQYDMFVRDVAQARNLDLNASETYAQGRIFSAKEALDLKLIDALGIRRDAQKKLIELSGVDEAVWFSKEPWEIYLERFMSESISTLSSLLASKIY
ncbi:MAG: signal peptide peptidase SppA [Wolinella sp.]